VWADDGPKKQLIPPIRVRKSSSSLLSAKAAHLFRGELDGLSGALFVLAL